MLPLILCILAFGCFVAALLIHALEGHVDPRMRPLSYALIGGGVVILIATVLTSGPSLVETLVAYRRVVVGAHILGVALGLGGATIADLFFFKYLRDLRLSAIETNTLRTLSFVVWIGLGLLAVSGVGLFLTDVDTYLHSAKFLTKVIVVGVIFVNGFFLNFVLTPHLKRMRFGKEHIHHPGELRHDRKLAFLSGALSVTSWYFAFAMGMIQKTSLTFVQLMAMYLVLVALAFATSLMLKRFLSRL